MKLFSFIFGLIIVAGLLFNPAAYAGVSSFDLQDNRIIIPVSINGQGPFFMMFDTGATNILSNQVAAALKLKKYGSFPISGGGEKVMTGSYCDVQKLEVSEEVLTNSRFMCMDLQDMQKGIGFPRLDGLIGYEVFSQFLTEINFDKMQINLTSFSDRKGLNANDQRLSLGFNGTTPTIDGALDGIQGHFLLDTGDRASSTLFTPFIEQNSLLQKYNPSFSTLTGFGIGGPLMTSMAFANQLQLGGLIFSNALIRLPTTRSAGLSDPTIAGTVGMGLFRQFNILLDYSRREMILTKNSAFLQDRTFDRSGMWLSPSAAGIEVVNVLDGGPAWKAGIRNGQLIVAVNGVDVSKINFLNLREQLKDPRNTQVVLTLNSGSGVQKVTIYLKDLIAVH